MFPNDLRKHIDLYLTLYVSDSEGKVKNDNAFLINIGRNLGPDEFY